MQGSIRSGLLSLVAAFGFVVTTAPGQSVGVNARRLAYSSYLGGMFSETITGIAVDAAGSMYVTGWTASQDFPITRGALYSNPPSPGTPGFLAKFSPAGNALVYSTFLPVTPSAIAVDNSGNVYLTGSPWWQFPTTPGASQTACKTNKPGGDCSNAFVAKLNPTGSALVYATFLGGSVGEHAGAIAVDSAGSAYVTGYTSSSDFPTTSGVLRSVIGCTTGTPCADAFLTKLNPSGSGLVYSTFLGEQPNPLGVAVDASGNAFVTWQGAVTKKLNPTATAVVYSFSLKCSGYTAVKAVAADASGNAYITGVTSARDFPVTPLAFQKENLRGIQEGFVVKLNATGTLAYSTYLGGSSGGDAANAIAVDSAGRAYIAGSTRSADYPVSPNAFQSRLGGTVSAFVTVLNSTGSDIEYSTYLGGGVGSGGGVSGPCDLYGSGPTSAATSVGVDSAGNAYVAGCTNTVDFPTANAFQAALRGQSDAFFAKIGLKKPAVNAGGTVNGASFKSDALAGASIGSLFGSDLASTTAAADTTPLPTSLAGVTVQMNDTKAPLFFVSPSQINFQVPWELMGLPQASLTVTADGVTGDPQTVAMALFAPGLFAANSAGSGQGAILISATGEVAAPTGSVPGRAARAVKRGEFLSIYCTGLGPVSNRPATGARSPSSPLSESLAPAVTIGGVPANVTFSGLAPSFVALYQVNVQVPDNAPPGNAVPVVLAIGGVTSNAVTIAVQ